MLYENFGQCFSILRKKMPKRCVEMCSVSVPSVDEGISVHFIPFYNDDRREAVVRRKRWVDFVKKTRAKWEPSKHSCVCSKHFKTEDYEQCYAASSSLPGFQKSFLRTLRTDAIGTIAFPTIYPKKDDAGGPSASGSTSQGRSHRLVRIF